MKGKKFIVYVNTFFEEGEKLFSTLKKYSKYSDERFAYWDEFAFAADDIPACDAVLVFNNPRKELIINTDLNRVIAFMMEPGVKTIHPWMFERLDQYSKIYSPLKNSSNSILSHGFLGWQPAYSWQYLTELKPSSKKQTISCISSNLNHLTGHKLRNSFIRALRKELPEIHYFGRGTQFLPDKFGGLLPYKYSVAIENTSLANYFTEKINDCFLARTIPLYYGCKNIGKYFPEKAFILIDINDPASAVKKIRNVLDNDDPESRMDALEEARDLVLNNYQPLAGAAEILRTLTESERQQVIIKPVRENFVRKARSLFEGIKQNILSGDEKYF